WFLTLSDGAQTAVFGLTGFTGVALTSAGAMLMLAPRILAVRDAISALGGVAMLGRVALVGTALGGLVAVGALVLHSWQKQKQAAEQYAGVLESLGDLRTNLQLDNMEQEVKQLEEFITLTEDIQKRIGEIAARELGEGG